MLSDNDWQHQHTGFIEESQILLERCQECLAHLEIIADDQDAFNCLLETLATLGEKADGAFIPCTADFSRQLQRLLSAVSPCSKLNSATLVTLGECLTLLAWQLELLDPHTGQLLLDECEQKELLDKLAHTCGLATLNAHSQQRLAGGLHTTPPN